MTPSWISLARRDTPPRQPRSPNSGAAPAGGTRGWIDRFGPWLGLIALCLALYVPGIATLPPTDRDESRFAQASRQMADTGDLVRIQFQDEARNKKPVLIYWVQAASALLFDAAPVDGKPPILPYRLPSLLGASIAVLLLYGIGRRLIGGQAAFLAASMLASALLTVVEAHIATTDAALLASSVASLGALSLIYTGEARGVGAALLFWIGIAFSILIKGPVVPMVALLAIVTLGIADRSLPWLQFLRWRWGVPLAVVIVAPWMIAIFTATGGSFYSDAITQDLLPKLIGGQESHGAIPGTYLLLVMLCFFPASLLLVPALWRAWIERRARVERFCLAWLVPAWIVFEAVPTKLPHYVLPLYPALALLAARAAGALDASPDGDWSVLPKRVWMIVGGCVWLVIALVVAALGLAVPVYLEHRIDATGVLAALVLLVGGIVALTGFVRATGRQPQAVPRPAARALMLGVGSAAIAFGLIFGTVLPGTTALWPSRSAAALVAPWREPGAPVAVAGYSEPSLVFQLGTFTQLGDAAGAAALMGRHGKALALIAGDQEDAFRTAAEAIGLHVKAEGTIRGFNISRGKWISLTLYRQL